MDLCSVRAMMFYCTARAFNTRVSLLVSEVQDVFHAAQVSVVPVHAPGELHPAVPRLAHHYHLKEQKKKLEHYYLLKRCHFSIRNCDYSLADTKNQGRFDSSTLNISSM